MEPEFDHGSASRHLADLVSAVGDDQLTGRSPCPDYSVADMIDHIGGLAIAFAAAARKQQDSAPQGPKPDGSRLEEGWRERIAHDLDALAQAWRDADAWEGMTQVGGATLPGSVTAVVALDELVIHGWDLAIATGQQPAVEPADRRGVGRSGLGRSADWNLRPGGRRTRRSTAARQGRRNGRPATELDAVSRRPC